MCAVHFKQCQLKIYHGKGIGTWSGYRFGAMGSNLTLGTGTGLFHLSKYGLLVEFGFIKDGKSTDGKISKIHGTGTRFSAPGGSLFFRHV